MLCRIFRTCPQLLLAAKEKEIAAIKVMGVSSSVEANVESNNYKLQAMKAEYELKIQNLQVSLAVNRILTQTSFEYLCICY